MEICHVKHGFCALILPMISHLLCSHYNCLAPWGGGGVLSNKHMVAMHENGFGTHAWKWISEPHRPSSTGWSQNEVKPKKYPLNGKLILMKTQVMKTLLIWSFYPVSLILLQAGWYQSTICFQRLNSMLSQSPAESHATLWIQHKL